MQIEAKSIRALIASLRKKGYILYDKPYQFLFVSTDTQRMFKCFDEIILDEDGEED